MILVKRRSLFRCHVLVETTCYKNFLKLFVVLAGADPLPDAVSSPVLLQARGEAAVQVGVDGAGICQTVHCRGDLVHNSLLLSCMECWFWRCHVLSRFRRPLKEMFDASKFESLKRDRNRKQHFVATSCPLCHEELPTPKC